jgi:hypothetical protein
MVSKVVGWLCVEKRTATRSQSFSVARRRPWGRRYHTALQECQVLEDRYRRGDRAKRSPADVETRRSSHLATLERLPPSESRRNRDALRQAAGAAAIARDFHRQVAEAQIRVAALNGFTALGTPVTEVAG